ncbi:YybH family protein [Auritidibacter ignavus]|uniref:YybH family protein n=1 Tax=Auritidibacter ignavus TaxID=678932 RepID=UPI00109C20A8|nr:SgcJ/EcaC family oxidoreductase [Auritidibacter ignavus]
MYLSTPDQPISLAAPKNIVYAFQQAWNQHDDHHLAKLFVADASFVSDTGLWWTGHDEIQRAHAEDFQGPLRAASIIVGRVELRMLGDGHAMVQARVTMTGHHDRTVPADHPRRMIMSFVLARTTHSSPEPATTGGAHWRIVSAHQTDLTTPGLAACVDAGPTGI